MTVHSKGTLVSRLPDIAILMMVIVIGVSLTILQRGDLVVLILLPLVVYLGIIWFKTR